MNPLLRHSQRGFGLVEALVALVVVSVGMIGIAVMYGQGLGASRTALYRTQAVILASDMADRIRLNRRGGITYQSAGAGTNRNCVPGGAMCSPVQMAEHDLWAWNAQIDRLLPGADGVVLFTAAAPPTYTIRITWADVIEADGTSDYALAIRVPDL
jgi:type IV pilus assembly protein PilV